MRVGIFGGTFDPPHIGHVSTLKCFIDSFSFDKTFVIPVCLPPHKVVHTNTTANDRIEMSRLAFEKLGNNVVISDLEIKREGKSYTADTIRYFVEGGYDDIYFLCGTDMILTLDRWYNPSYIFANATIVYARREMDEETTKKIEEKTKEYKEKFGAKVVELNVSPIEISSTTAREGLKRGKSEFLDAEVLEYIKTHKLYECR